MNRPQRNPPNSPCVLCGYAETESTEPLEISGTDIASPADFLEWLDSYFAHIERDRTEVHPLPTIKQAIESRFHELLTHI